MSGIRRPTEGAALAAVSRSPRPRWSIDALLAAVAACQRRGDREGARLSLKRALRLMDPEVAS